MWTWRSSASSRAATAICWRSISTCWNETRGYTGLSDVWEGDSLDWKDLSADEIYKRVTSKVAPGSIVLFHNAGKYTPEALPGIIEYLLSEGYEIVPVGQLLLSGEHDIDSTGRMIARNAA